MNVYKAKTKQKHKGTFTVKNKQLDNKPCTRTPNKNYN